MPQINQVDKIPMFTLDLDAKELSLSLLSMKTQTYLQKLEHTLSQAAAESKHDEVARNLSYVWSHAAKEIAILLRDCALNLLKIKYLHSDGYKTQEEVDQYKTQVITQISTATQALQKSYLEITGGPSKDDPKWIHQINPTPVIISQLQIISDQIKKIQRSQHKLDNIALSFDAYKKDYVETMDVRIDRINEMETLLKDVVSSIKALPKTASKTAVNHFISNLNNYQEKLEKEKELPNYEAITLEDIDKLVLPVAATNGRLLFKTVDILSEVSTWTSFHLAGSLRNADRKYGSFREQVSIALVQIANRLKAKVDTSEEDEITLSLSDINRAIQKLINEFDESIISGVKNSLSTIDQEFNDLLQVSRLFDNNQLFFPTTRISQLASGLSYKEIIQHRYNFNRIINKFHLWTNGYFTKEKILEKPNAGKYIDKIIELDAQNDKNALFVKKGFLGSSFHIDRPVLQKAISDHFELWQSGFGGALLITGKGGSGRSSMLELLPLMYPEMDSHHVVKGQNVNIKGRKISMGTDLIKALKHIIAYQGIQPCIITIDDIEQFADDPSTLYNLIQDLEALISRYTQKVYFVVVMNQGQLDRLQSYFELDTIFSSIISTDNMAPSLIEEAILIRVMAVADHDDATYNVEQIRQSINTISKSCHRNIGIGLQQWCLKESDDTSLSLDAFSDKIIQHKNLLSYLLSFEKIDLGFLKKIYDEVAFANLKTKINHLYHQKILVKDKEGVIRIEPLLKYQIQQIISSFK